VFCFVEFVCLLACLGWRYCLTLVVFVLVWCNSVGLFLFYLLFVYVCVD